MVWLLVSLYCFYNGPFETIPACKMVVVDKNKLQFYHLECANFYFYFLLPIAEMDFISA